MIHLTLKDKELETKAEVRKYLDKLEKIINEKFPEEKLKKIQDEWNYCYMTGAPFCIDADGNIVDPMVFYNKKT